MTTQATHARLSFLAVAIRDTGTRIANRLARIPEQADLPIPRHRNRLGAWETHASFRAAALCEKRRVD